MTSMQYRLLYWKCVNGLARAVSIGCLGIGLVAALLEMGGLILHFPFESSELMRSVLLEKAVGTVFLLCLAIVGWFGIKARPYYPADLRDSDDAAS